MIPTPPPSGIQDPIAAPPSEIALVAADGADSATLVNAIIVPTPGLVVDPASIVVVSGPGSIAYYNGGLTALGLGAGLLITSGTMPGFSNTVGWFGQDNGMAGDADLDAVINPVFQTMSYDATSISFNFNFEITDPSITGISFNIVFGTDEYPEWVDQFVDIAAIVVNGVNVAFFGNDPNAPLSVISQNLAAGYFINNGDGHLPIEYDGVSHVLTVFAPVHMGTNNIKIAIADTGDHIYDSGLFISGFHGTNLPTTGVSQDVPCTEGDDDISGGSSSEVINGLGGDDHLDGGGGDDVLSGGSGADVLLGGSGDDFLDGGSGADSLNGGQGDDVLQYSGADSLDGGDGQDTAMIDLSAGAAAAILDFTDPAAIQALPDGSTIVHVETVGFTGGSGNDQVTGGAGADKINGGLGDDLLAGGGGDDAIDGGDGVDTAAFSGSSFNYKVTASGGGYLVEDLRPGAPDGADHVLGVETFRFSNGDFDAASLVSHGETILGTAGDDVLGGSAFDDAFASGAGDDIIDALGGNDLIDLGADNDIVHAGAGDDVITGGLGDDEVWGDDGVDTMVFSGNFADYDIIEQGDGYRITDLRPGSPDGRDQAVGVEFAAFADGVVKLTIGSTPVIEPGIVDGQFAEPVAPTGVATVAGAIVFSDNDHDDTHSLAVTGGTGDQSGLTFHAAMGVDAGGGHVGQVDWSLDIDTAVINALGEGQVRTVTYTVRITDSAGNSVDQDVTVDITGGNDAPVVSGDILAQVSAATGLVTVNPLANASDADMGAKLHIAAAPDTLPAGVVFDPVLQTFSVDPSDPALLAATGGGDATLTIDYLVTDGLAQTPARIIFQVTGSGLVGATIVGTSGADIINGVTAPAGQPHATQAGDTISGGAGNDTISSLGGGDTLDGGTGNDTLDAGAGDDVIVIRGTEALKDVFNGGSGGEILGDAVRVEGLASVSLTGFDAVARGIERWNGNGQGVVGTSAADRFDLSGLAQVTGLAFVDAGGGNDILIGSAFADDLRGGAGNDDLDGGAGADILQGGIGNDVYHVDNAGDLIVEAAASGTDTVLSSIDFSLAGTNLEHLTIVGATGRTGTGNALANRLTGGAGADTLNGDAGNDTLDGGAGADTLAGGLGDDIFLVDDAGDLVVEAANGGKDTVRATAASYALAANIEALTYVGGGAFNGVGNDLANTITGGAGNDALDGGAGDDKLYGGLGADSLVGGAGRDTLDGGAGADSLAGGLGNDTYVIDDALDQILELAGGGTDSAKVTAASWTMSDQVESMTFTGAGDFAGTGNAAANTLTGGAGNDTLAGLAGADRLNGGAGNDQLIGGAGADTLTGGLGADVFVFGALSDSLASGQDRIADFSRAQGDHIDLGLLDADTGLAGDQAFTFIGSAAFTHHAGELRYAIAGGTTTVSVDVNGDGVADFAFRLTGAMDLTATDFFL